jgi:hypothetical protein
MSELLKLRAAWEAERSELELRHLALMAIDASITAGHYKEAQALLCLDADWRRPAHEERRSDKAKKKRRHRVDEPDAPPEGATTKTKTTKKKKGEQREKMPGRPRATKEGFEWHSSINNHTKFRCTRCDDIVGVRVLKKHQCCQ